MRFSSLAGLLGLVALESVYCQAEDRVFLARVDTNEISCQEAKQQFSQDFPSATIQETIETKNNCIIKYVSNKSSDDQTAEARLSVASTFESWLDGIEEDSEVTIQTEDTSAIESIVKQASETRGSASGPYAWHLDRLDQPSPYLDHEEFDRGSFTGSNVTVYTLDSGVYPDHLEFNHTNVVVGPNFHEEDSSLLDLNGHGTHVASLVVGKNVGVAPDANLVAVKVVGYSGSGKLSSLIKGLAYIIEDAASTPSIISISLTTAQSDTLDDLVAEATDNGHFVFVAAGNDSKDACEFSPAASQEAITVGASTLAYASRDSQQSAEEIIDKVASFSNTGGCVDGYAPGVFITGAKVNTTDSYMTMSGTSMATPIAAGSMALLFEKHSFDRNAAMLDLISMALPVVVGADDDTQFLLSVAHISDHDEENADDQDGEEPEEDDEESEEDDEESEEDDEESEEDHSDEEDDEEDDEDHSDEEDGEEDDEDDEESEEDHSDEEDDEEPEEDHEDDAERKEGRFPQTSIPTAQPSKSTGAPTATSRPTLSDQEEEEQDNNEHDESSSGSPLMCSAVLNKEIMCYSFAPSTFGHSLDSIDLVAPMSIPKSSYSSLCRKLPPKVSKSIKDTIVLVKRGYCSFVQKVLRAQEAGAVGVVLYRNDNRNSLFYPEADQDEQEDAKQITIPSVLVTRDTANLLKESLQAVQQQNVELWFGQADDNEGDEENSFSTLDSEKPETTCETLNDKKTCRRHNHCRWDRGCKSKTTN